MKPFKTIDKTWMKQTDGYTKENTINQVRIIIMELFCISS